jgi:hypothetical protein
VALGLTARVRSLEAVAGLLGSHRFRFRVPSARVLLFVWRVLFLALPPPDKTALVCDFAIAFHYERC